MDKPATPASSAARDYICPCGKSYLSYAALFTHIKQKHNGTVPILLARHRAKFRNLQPPLGPGAGRLSESSSSRMTVKRRRI